MRYEKQILDAYDRIGYKPRDRQVEHINTIVVAFLDEGYKNVILSAPTGTGKSVIGAVAAEVVHSIRYPDKDEGASFLLTATNVLAHQYHDSFVDDENPLDHRFFIIKGGANYECGALSTPEEPAGGDVCAIRVFQKTKMESMIRTYCDSCEYLYSRTMKAKARHLITNYAYYFLDRLFSTYPMEKRTICVFDEIHLMNDLFTEQKSVFLSEKRIDACVKECNEAFSVSLSETYRDFKNLKDALSRGKITENNYRDYLKKMLEIYRSIHKVAEVQMERNQRSHREYLKFSKIAKKYHNLTCAIDDLFLFEYPHVFEYKEKDPKKGQNDHEMTVKPIFIGEMFEALDNADHNLLMSATISEQYVTRTMSLPGTTKTIRLPPQFPPENKRVIFFKPQALNYNTMKDPQTVKKLCATAFEIVKHHTDKGERGIILCPSFVVVQAISEVLRMMGGNYRVFEHERGQKLPDKLNEFKAYTSGPAVLLTPSGFEGIDLPGDLSRFQVIVKAPYGSLGDKRVAHILNVYPDIYSLITLMKITQGAGRSVRSMEDYATTYMLDTGIQRLWAAKNNAWSDEFATTYTSQLSDA